MRDICRASSGNNSGISKPRRTKSSAASFPFLNSSRCAYKRFRLAPAEISSAEKRSERNQIFFPSSSSGSDNIHLNTNPNSSTELTIGNTEAACKSSVRPFKSVYDKPRLDIHSPKGIPVRVVLESLKSPLKTSSRP